MISASASGRDEPTVSASHWVNSRNRPGPGFSFRQTVPKAYRRNGLGRVSQFWAANLARGASLDNTLALDDSGVVNKDIQRFPDEFVRHKILDAIGDMALAGAPLIARFEGAKSGHGTNNALLRALFADPANYRLLEL